MGCWCWLGGVGVSGGGLVWGLWMFLGLWLWVVVWGVVGWVSLLPVRVFRRLLA